MLRNVLLSMFFLCGLLSSAVLAQDKRPDPLHDASTAHEEHAHENDVAAILALTYESEENKNLFTVGGEYSRKLGSRVRLTALTEHLNDPGAWVFVFPVAWRLWKGLWVSAGPGFEAKSRRSLAEEEAQHGSAVEGHQGELIGSDDLEGSEKLFLVRAGAYYVFELGGRYSLKTGAAVDWVDTPSGTATAVVYGVVFGVGF